MGFLVKSSQITNSSESDNKPTFIYAKENDGKLNETYASTISPTQNYRPVLRSQEDKSMENTGKENFVPRQANRCGNLHKWGEPGVHQSVPSCQPPS